MSLSQDTINRLKYALANNVAGQEVADAIDTGTALASGKIIVGDANGVAADVTLSGDATMANTGAITLAATALAQATKAIVKTDVGVKDVLVAAARARRVIITVTVDEAYADGGGTQPTLTIGEESGSASKFMAVGKLAAAAAASTFTFAGSLTSGKKLQCTAVAAIGAGTGGVTIDVIAVGI